MMILEIFLVYLFICGVNIEICIGIESILYIFTLSINVSSKYTSRGLMVSDSILVGAYFYVLEGFCFFSFALLWNFT